MCDTCRVNGPQGPGCLQCPLPMNGGRDMATVIPYVSFQVLVGLAFYCQSITHLIPAHEARDEGARADELINSRLARNALTILPFFGAIVWVHLGRLDDIANG